MMLEIKNATSDSSPLVESRTGGFGRNGGTVTSRLHHLPAMVSDKSLSEGCTPGTGGLCGKVDLHQDHAGGEDLSTATLIDYTIVEMETGTSKLCCGNSNP